MRAGLIRRGRKERSATSQPKPYMERKPSGSWRFKNLGPVNHKILAALAAGDMGRMVKRRMRDAGLPVRLSPHSFRVATITDLLNGWQVLR